MAITVPSELEVIKTSALLSAAADAEPLQSIVENTHHMWCYGPAHLVAVYTCEAKITFRSAVFQIPVVPSAAGITYTFQHYVRTGTGTSNLSITVDEWVAGAWNTLESATAIAAAANTVVGYSHTDTLAAESTKIRITISRATGLDEFTPDSITVYPTETSIATGVQSTGFAPLDDGLISAVGAPIHTEFFNRAIYNAQVVLQDRKQCVMSFVQEDGSASAPLYEPSAASMGAGVWVRFGLAVASLPYQVDPSIDVYALASVNAGTDTSLVRVSQAGHEGQAVTFDADGAVNTLALQLNCDGTEGAGARLRLDCTHKSGQETYVHAVVAFWQPGT